MINIYKDSSTQKIVIKGVITGLSSEFNVYWVGEKVSINYLPLDVYKIRDLHYSRIADENGNNFLSLQDAANYINSIFTNIENDFTAYYILAKNT